MASHTLTGPSAATALALANASANAKALRASQTRTADAVGPLPTSVAEWLYGRDGSLSALDHSGHWWAGCSVPRLAARQILKSLDVGGRVAGLLCPRLAAQIRAALDALRPEQAVIILSPDVQDLNVALHADDFSDAIAAGRLWFAWGEGWQDELRRLFDENPGLATPSQFIRLPTTPAEDVERMVSAAQQVFFAVTTRRAATMSHLRDGWRPTGGLRRRLCVVAPSHFRLWQDGGAVLRDAMHAAAEAAPIDIVPFDPDRPTCSSPLAFATAAAACDAVVSADVGRGDSPPAVPPAMPWVTWVTTPRIPPALAAGPNDAIVLADAGWVSPALAAGWTRDRIGIAGWPIDEVVRGAARGAFLAIVAGTRPLDPPDALSEFSSHVLLWERLREHITRDPFLVGSDPGALFARVARDCDIDAERTDPHLFVEGLIVPAYQQAMARLLLREGLPLRLFGKGWDSVEAFAPFAAGPVRSREDLRAIASDATAFVHAWPGGYAHPVEALRRPVVRPGSSERVFLQHARGALVVRPTPQPTSPRLAEAVLSALT